jgi:acyl-CoA thioester hydrolase
VVFYANYLKFFERARTEWLRALGLRSRRCATRPRRDLRRQPTPGALPAPARLDDLLEVTVQLVEPARVDACSSRPGGTAARRPLLAEGSIRIGCVDAGTSGRAAFPTPCRPTGQKLIHR